MASISNIFKKISDFFNDGELQNAPKLNGSLAEQNTAKKSNPSGSSPGYSFVQPKSGSKSGSTSSGNASVFTRNTSTGSTGGKDSAKPSTPSTAGFMFNRSTESTTPKPGKENVADASDLQQKLYGYVLAGYGEDAAKQTMEGINSWKQSVKDVVQGDGALAASAQSQEGALYREYLGLTGTSAPGINATSDEDTTVAQVIWDLGVTTANQIPQWAAVLAGSYVGGPALGRVLGAAVMGTGVYGNSYNQSIKEGYSEKQATIYAATQAAMEGGVGILLDGVGKTAGVFTTKVLGTEVFQNITNPWVKAFADLGIRAASEGTEEYIQEIADPIIRNIVLDENNDFNLMSDEAKYSFILGALSAGLMDMVNLNVNIKSNVTAERLGNALNTVGADSKLVDTILNNPVEADDALGITKEQAKLYGEAKSMAEGMKSGTIKATGMNVGKMTQLYGAAGGDLGFLTNPSTVSYNKSQLTSGDLEAGAKARLVQLNADTKTADVIVKLAMGEQVSAEEQAVFDAEPQAKTVLS